MNRDHTPIVLSRVNGLYDRSDFEDSVPTDHFSIADNIAYGERGWETRPGTSELHTLGNIRRFVHYKRLNEVSRLLILNNVGALYDSTDLGTPILTIPAMVDFSATQYFNSIYITPHNRTSGIEGEVVYVYDGTTCRPAGASSPSGTLTVVNSALSGHVEAGTHLVAVAFETQSGYISKPGPALYGVVSSDGTKQLDISGIPVGPAGTVARRILSTKRIAAYNGNQEGFEFFFVPTGRIANNTDTTATVDFYDADLVVSGDYLFDQLTTIPAGVGITTFQESLVVWGEFAEQSVVRVSKRGDPESFDAVEGYLTVAPNEAGGVKNCVEFRDSLYILKSQRTYSTARDFSNENSAIFWKIISIDEGIGTECFGIANILDTSGPNTDNFLVAAQSGLFLFNGIYLQPEFSWKIDSLWHAVDHDNFDEIQVYNDVVANNIYVLLPDGNLLVGDYKNGLSYDAVRWARWTFPWDITAIAINVGPDELTELLLAGNGTIWRLDPEALNDDDTAINTVVHYAPIGVGEYGSLAHFHVVRIRATGEGNLETSLHSIDHTHMQDLLPIALSENPGREYQRLCNFVGEKCALKFELDAFGEYVRVLNVTLFANETWAERPNDIP